MKPPEAVDDAPPSKGPASKDRLGYARSLRVPERTALEVVEAAAGWCAVAGAVAAIAIMLGYVAKHATWMPSSGWWRLGIQTLTFGTVTGAGCGAGLAAVVLGLGALHGGARWWHVLGGVGAVPAAAIAGAFGAMHFGTKPLPYLGVGAIFAAVGLGVLVAGTGIARTARRGLPWRWALVHGLWPSVALAACFGAAASLAPPNVDAELDIMRGIAASIGLSTLGALGGGFIGLVGGLALAATLVSARGHAGAATSPP
jgi:hypothetical protein